MSEQTALPKGKLMTIKIADIRENPDALRSVNRTKEKYLELVDSIRQVGILHPLNVREVADREDPSKTVYGLIDGLHRFTGAQDAGLTEVPAYVINMTDAQVLEAQMMANVHNVETKYSEYSDQLIRILGANPTLTINDLAKRLAKSPKWLGDRLSITKLHERIQKIVDEGKMNLTNAYALAKLKDADEQLNFLDRAVTEGPAVFVPMITQRVKELKDAKRKGTDAAPEQFVAVVHLRKPRELEEELTSKHFAEIMKGKGHVRHLDDFLMGVAWAGHLDPDSVDEARLKWENRKKEREEARAKAKIEKAKKQKEEADKILAGIESASPELVGV